MVGLGFVRKGFYIGFAGGSFDVAGIIIGPDGRGVFRGGDVSGSCGLLFLFDEAFCFDQDIAVFLCEDEIGVDWGGGCQASCRN